MRSIDYLEELNDEQRQAVLHDGGSCLVLAGAGSGKTRTVTYRVARLLEIGSDPQSILLLTFTNKAAREMLDRIILLSGAQSKGIWGGTFHSIANRLLRSFASSLGYTSGFSILDEDDARGLMKAVVKDARLDVKAKRFPSAAVLRNVHSFSRNTGRSISDVLEERHPNFLDCRSQIQELLETYQIRKQQANVMDFDDLLCNWLLLMETVPSAAEAIRSRFQHILVDEYQDTNRLQARIVQLLSGRGFVFAVGDDAQAIYKFRGADVEHILSFSDQFPNTSIYSLTSNYRSTPQILSVANAVLSNNERQYQKELTGMRSAGPRPCIIACPSARQEAQYIADQILLLRNEGIALQNMAVLFRASSHSHALEFELTRRDIPFEYRGGVTFFDRAHIKDALAFLRILENPKDEPAWRRVLHLQAGIGAVSASRIMDCLREKDAENILAIEDAQLPIRARDGWRQAVSVLSALGGRGTVPGPAISALTESEMYRLYLEQEYPDWKERLEDLRQLALFADSYKDLHTFLADLTLDQTALGSPNYEAESFDGLRIREEERIVLSTIHQAKGLEWDTVFLMHLTNLSFPNPRALEEEGGVEEERRLFYVAVTRARHRLFLTYPQTIGYGTPMFCRPSLFLEEIPSYATERMTIGVPYAVRPRSDSAWVRESNDVFDSDDEAIVEIGRDGEAYSRLEAPVSTSVWKTSKPKLSSDSPRSFLRNVEDL